MKKKETEEIEKIVKRMIGEGEITEKIKKERMRVDLKND